MKRKILLVMIMLSMLCSAVFNGCAKTLPPAGTAEIDTLIVGTPNVIGKPTPADSYYVYIAATLSMMAPLYMTPDGKFEPRACDFTVSPDYTTFTFTMKEGLTWHDGKPVTIEDFKFTIDYRDAQEPSSFPLKRDKIESMSINGNSLTIVMNASYVTGLNDFTTLRLLPKHIYDGQTLASYEGMDANINCGPYRYSGYDADAGTLTFTRYDDYFGGKANVKTVIFKMYSNWDTMIMALLSGEVDMVNRYGNGVDPVYIPALQSRDDITLQVVNSAAIPSMLIFANDKAPGNDVNFRKAVASAIDFEFARTVLGSVNSVVGNTGIINSSTYGYRETEKNSYDLAKFAGHMAAYGATKEAGGYYYKNGEIVSLEITVRSDQSAYVRAAEIIANCLNVAGISCKIDALASNAYLLKVGSAPGNTPSAQAAVIAMTAAGVDFDYGFGTRYLYGPLEHAAQSGRIFDAAYLAIIEDFKKATSIEAYMSAARDIQDFYATNVPAVALYYDGYTYAYNSRLSGFREDATFGLLNISTWFTIKSA